MNQQAELLGTLVARLSQLDCEQLREVAEVVNRVGMAKPAEGIGYGSGETAVQRNESGSCATALQRDGSCATALTAAKDWPHAPVHRLEGLGAFIVTGGTLHKQHHFRGADALDYLERKLFAKAKEYDWRIEAWAVFSNHYHFVAQALADAKTLSSMLKSLHSETALWINQRHNTPERQVWYNFFWDTELTYTKSYQARLHYVHRNAQHHGLVLVPNQYPWCSAAWFERTATTAQVRTIYSFKTDLVNVIDEFQPVL